jgi:hypothetical protein
MRQDTEPLSDDDILETWDLWPAFEDEPTVEMPSLFECMQEGACSYLEKSPCPFKSTLARSAWLCGLKYVEAIIKKTI